jgi:hypothetical protein
MPNEWELLEAYESDLDSWYGEDLPTLDEGIEDEDGNTLRLA